MDLPQKVKKNKLKTISYNVQNPNLLWYEKSTFFKIKYIVIFYRYLTLHYVQSYLQCACLYIRTLRLNLNFSRYFLLPQWFKSLQIQIKDCSQICMKIETEKGFANQTLKCEIQGNTSMYKSV